MVALVPKGLGKIFNILPLAPYRCLRCGKKYWRLNDAYSVLTARLLILAWLIAAGTLIAWYTGSIPLPFSTASNSVRREVSQRVHTKPAPSVDMTHENATVSNATQAPQQYVASPAPVSNASTEVATVSPAPDFAQKAPALSSTGSMDKSLPPEPPLETIPAPAPFKAATPAHTANTAKSVTVTHSNKSVRLVITTKAPVKEFSSFSLASPDRFIVDIPGQWTYRGDTKVTVKNGILKNVRTGEHPDKLRVVLDLKKRPASPPQVNAISGGLQIVIPDS